MVSLVPEGGEPRASYRIAITPDDFPQFVGGTYMLTHRESGHGTAERGTITDIQCAPERDGHTITFFLQAETHQGVNYSRRAEEAHQVGAVTVPNDPTSKPHKIFVPDKRVSGYWEVETYEIGSGRLGFRNSVTGDGLYIVQPVAEPSLQQPDDFVLAAAPVERNFWQVVFDGLQTWWDLYEAKDRVETQGTVKVAKAELDTNNETGTLSFEGSIATINILDSSGQVVRDYKIDRSTGILTTAQTEDQAMKDTWNLGRGLAPEVYQFGLMERV